MPRAYVLLLLCALTAVLPAGAQEQATLPANRLQITLLAGVRSSLLTDTETPVILAGRLLPAAVSLEPQRRPGSIGGAEVDLRLVRRLGIAAALLYSNADPYVLTTRIDTRIVSQLRVNGPAVWLARAGISYRLPEVEWEGQAILPAGYLVVGPALLRQDFENSLLRVPGMDNEVDSWALHFGYRALIPLGSPHLALQVMVEDYVPFWNREGEVQRIQRILDLTAAGNQVLSADLSYDRSHILLLHLGLALRL